MVGSIQSIVMNSSLRLTFLKKTFAAEKGEVHGCIECFPFTRPAPTSQSEPIRKVISLMAAVLGLEGCSILSSRRQSSLPLGSLGNALAEQPARLGKS